MSCSSARLLANRKNSLQSTGPKTAEGKAKSRQNALKHGLTGNGVVMAPEQLPEVNRRFETLQAELKPSGEAGRIFLRRFAYLSVRLEKCEEFDTMTTAERLRHAVARFDDNRLTEVEALVMNFAADPLTVTRRLQYSPEGVDWLLKHCRELREDLTPQNPQAWTLNHRSRLEQILGEPGGNVRMSRVYALSQAVSGYFAYLGQNDGAGLDDDARIDWARRELLAIIDAEIERLRDVRTSLDPSAIEQDRLEAPSRALFDPSHQRNLARKYEAATERAMYKALETFHEIELLALEDNPVVATADPEEPCEQEMASFFPRSDLGLDPFIEPAGSAPQSVYLCEVRESGEFGVRTEPTRSRQKVS